MIDIFGCESNDIDAVDLGCIAAAECLFMIGPRFLKNNIDLPTSFHIQNVEHGFVTASFKSSV